MRVEAATSRPDSDRTSLTEIPVKYYLSNPSPPTPLMHELGLCIHIHIHLSSYLSVWMNDKGIHIPITYLGSLPYSGCLILIAAVGAGGGSLQVGDVFVSFLFLFPNCDGVRREWVVVVVVVEAVVVESGSRGGEVQS